MTDLAETPWVDRTMREIWERVAERVPESWLPRRGVMVKAGSEKTVIEELGCGHYGCVMPTNEPGLVCKLTTDISEARFVVMAMTLGHVDGIVSYKEIFALRDKTFR